MYMHLPSCQHDHYMMTSHVAIISIGIFVSLRAYQRLYNTCLVKRPSVPRGGDKYDLIRGIYGFWERPVVEGISGD